MSLLDKITLEDLSEEQRQLAEIVGMDAYRQLVRVYGGCSVYIPKAEGLEKSARNDAIRADFTGYNYRYLAAKYNLTEVTIRAIVSEIDRKMKADPGSDQIRLFGGG